MCGRFQIAIEHSKIADAPLKHSPEFAKKAKTPGEFFPTDIVPVLVYENGKPTVRLMQWVFPIAEVLVWQTERFARA